jgi:cholesterol oxidase
MTPKSITADRVVLAAGCVGTTEILLRSRRHIPGLSNALGSRFSTNGDYLAFLDRTERNVNLVRGPVTTSFAHFNTPQAAKGASSDERLFHTIEDQGIPPALASLVGLGIPFIRKISNYRGPKIIALWLIFWWAIKRVWGLCKAILQLPYKRPYVFESAEEQTSRMMCIAAMGREAAVGRFRLGGRGESTLRVSRDDDKAFKDDPIYDHIRASLHALAGKLRAPNDPGDFINPFLTSAADALASKSVTLTHALGGCPMGATSADGVVDDLGRVYDTSNGRIRDTHPGLYVADASMIPTALGVNPSLTISALALNVARGIVTEITGQAPPW